MSSLGVSWYQSLVFKCDEQTIDGQEQAQEGEYSSESSVSTTCSEPKLASLNRGSQKLIGNISEIDTQDILPEADFEHDSDCDSNWKPLGELDEFKTGFDEEGTCGLKVTYASVMEALDNDPEFKEVDPCAYYPVRRVQDAARNCGSVELLKEVKNGSFVVVKRMPNKWVQDGPTAFLKRYPDSMERPWVDIGMVRFLHEMQSPYVCEPLGIYRDADCTYVMSSFAEHGDLFSWCGSKTMPAPGPARERMITPVARQVVFAVQYLHRCGVAHRDISLENVVLTGNEKDGLKAKLIDFGMATTDRLCTNEVCGKPSYQAPEMHLSPHTYDSFQADAFAVGVTVACMASSDYPWLSTRPGACNMFTYVNTNGFPHFLAKRKVRGGNGARWVDVMSEELLDLIVRLVVVDPKERCMLVDNCTTHGDAELLPSVEECEYLRN